MKLTETSIFSASTKDKQFGSNRSSSVCIASWWRCTLDNRNIPGHSTCILLVNDNIDEILKHPNLLVSKTLRSSKYTLPLKPPNIINLFPISVPVWAYLAGGCIPCTEGMDHVIVARSRTWRSLLTIVSGDSLPPALRPLAEYALPPNTNNFFPTKVAVWPPRGAGGLPYVGRGPDQFIMVYGSGVDLLGEKIEVPFLPSNYSSCVVGSSPCERSWSPCSLFSFSRLSFAIVQQVQIGAVKIDSLS